VAKTGVAAGELGSKPAGVASRRGTAVNVGVAVGQSEQGVADGKGVPSSVTVRVAAGVWVLLLLGVAEGVAVLRLPGRVAVAMTVGRGVLRGVGVAVLPTTVG
jgi:hypothetical protein